MNSARHVAVCPFPFPSHAATMLLLTRKIASTGPVDLQISFFTTASSASGLKLSPEESDGSSRIRIRHVEEGPAPIPGVHPLEAIKALVTAIGQNLGKAVAQAEEELGVKISFVLSDAIMTFACRQIAEERVVKWAAMWTSSATALTAHMHTDLLRNSVGRGDHIEEETADEYIPGYPPIPITDLPYEILAKDDPIGLILHIMSHHLSEAAAVIMNSFQQLEPAAINILNSSYPNKFHCAGPYAITMSTNSTPSSAEDPYGCLLWLDAHPPSSVVYVSFGSGHTPPLEEFASLSEALEVVKVPFLFSLPDRFRSHLPEKMTAPGLGKVVPWAPQTAVLGHKAVGAHLTHGGWKSVLESILAGVPMICRLSRSIAEQAFNVRRVVDKKFWGIGVEVEGGRMTKEATVEALDRVFVREEGKAMRKNIGELKMLAEEALAQPDNSTSQSLTNFITLITT